MLHQLICDHVDSVNIIHPHFISFNQHHHKSELDAEMLTSCKMFHESNRPQGHSFSIVLSDELYAFVYS